jgi:hypothetical protein
MSNEWAVFRDVSLVDWWTSGALRNELVAEWRKKRGTQRYYVKNNGMTRFQHPAKTSSSIVAMKLDVSKWVFDMFVFRSLILNNIA